MKKFYLNSTALGASNVRVSVRCPHCGHKGTFEALGQDVQVFSNAFGLRKCPNEKCFGHLFFVYDYNTRGVVVTYPSDSIPFDKENIPEKVLNAFEEAIVSHSTNCFVAAAIMIRKTLEEICHERAATGKTLYDRLKVLGEKIIVPQELVDGLQELRLLGNDAAHIESNTFNEIGKDEIEISIEFTKEILKAVYQYESLLGKLRSLKKIS